MAGAVVLRQYHSTQRRDFLAQPFRSMTAHSLRRYAYWKGGRHSCAGVPITECAVTALISVF